MAKGKEFKTPFMDAIVPVPGGGGGASGGGNGKGFKTAFKDAVVSDTPDLSGDWGATHGGDTTFQGAVKGGGGRIPEVTFVEVQSAPKAGGHAIGDKSVVANKKVKPDLKPF